MVIHSLLLSLRVLGAKLFQSPPRALETVEAGGSGKPWLIKSARLTARALFLIDQF